MQIVVADPDKGKTYQKEIEDKKARALHGKTIGDEVEGSLLDLKGYSLQITGGSDKQGFPMKKGIKTTERRKVLMEKGTGYRPQEQGKKKRKTVRGQTISDQIQQLNLKVIKTGKKKLPVLFGEEEPEEEPEEEEQEEPEETEEENEEEEPEEEEQEEDEDEEEKEEIEDVEMEEKEEPEVDYEELAEKNISEIKEQAEEFTEEQYQELLEAEQENKDRATLKEWIEKQLE